MLHRRLLWLLACVGSGSAIGGIAYMLTSDSAWFLAIPACMAVGWWYFADPQQCVAAPSRRDDGTTVEQQVSKRDS